MSTKIIAGLALTAFLTGCGGANDHPEELKGSWSTNCSIGNIETYTFDSALTLTIKSHSDANCTTRSTVATIKLNAMYNPELKMTSSGIEALRAELTLADDITFTPYDDFSLQSFKNTCPQQIWIKGQATSIMECEHSSVKYVINSFEPNLPILFYISNNNLLTNNSSSPKDDDGYARDVDYNRPYAKQ